MNPNKIKNLTPKFDYNDTTIVAHFTTSYAMENGINDSGLKSMSRYGIAFTLLTQKQALYNIMNDIHKRHIKNIKTNKQIYIYALIISVSKLIELNCEFSTDLDDYTKFTVMIPDNWKYIPIKYFDIYVYDEVKSRFYSEYKLFYKPFNIL